MIYRLSLRDERQNVGGAVLGGRLEQWQGGAPVLSGLPARNALAVEARVAFLLHGYNVSLSDGTGALTRFAALLGAVPGGLVATVWPGDSVLGGISYPFEGHAADDAAMELARFAEDTLAPGTPISFVSHSLGGRVALGAMRLLAEAGIATDQVCLMAAAVDDFSLADAEEFRAGVEAARRVGVLHSKADRVLKWLYPVGDLFQAFAFFAREEPGLALGYRGPRPARGLPVPGNVIDRAVGDHGVDHGHYLPHHDPNAPLDGREASAAAYAEQVLTGVAEPEYPPPGP